MNGDMTRGLRTVAGKIPGYTDIMRDGWSLYFAVLPQWIGLALPALLISALLQAWAAGSGATLRAVSVAIPCSLLTTFAGAALYLLVWRELRGSGESTAEVWQTAARRTLPIWFTAIGVGLLAGFGTILLLVPGLWIMIRLLFAQLYANLAPELGSPIPRSYDLTNGRFWWTAGLLATLIFLACFLLIPALLVKWLATGFVGETVYVLLASLVTGPLMAAFVVAFEALLTDREFATANAGMAVAPAGFVPPAPAWLPATPEPPQPTARPAGPDASPATPESTAARSPADEELSRGGSAAPFE